MTRMSTDRLRSARGYLLARRAELDDRVARVRSDLRRESVPLPGAFGDIAIAMENDEILAAVEKSACSELEHIRAALKRLDDGTFGLCASCATEIDGTRLRAVPYATQCPACAQGG